MGAGSCGGRNSERRSTAPGRRALHFGFWLLAGIGAAAALVWFGSGSKPPLPQDVDVEPGPPPTEPHLESVEGSPPGAAAVPLWRVVEESSVVSTPRLGERWSAAGRVLVDVSHASATAHGWREGDRLLVDIPQLGIRYDVEIDRVADGPGRSRAARGAAVDADGRKRRVVVTVGPGRVFAYVDTAQGPYELQGDDRLGWLLPSSSMMAGIDFTKPDTIPRPQDNARRGESEHDR
ncbi:MAG: hypothetical protein OXP36_01900 [Gammaproteobacteria bacterium]|nr:hypothetical protein [Gammaproteobacteria bacterium]